MEMFESTFQLADVKIKVKTNSANFYRQLHDAYRHTEIKDNAPSEFNFFIDCSSIDERGKPVYKIVSGDHGLIFSGRNFSEIFPVFEWYFYDYAASKLDNFIQIHAGSVSTGETGILFPASKNSGKTSLITGLLFQGYRYLTEDIALIDPESLKIIPFPRVIWLTESHLNLFNSEFNFVCKKGYDLIFREAPLWFVNPLEINGTDIGDPINVGYIIFLEYNPSKNTEIKSISKTEALKLLIKHSSGNPVQGKLSTSKLIDVLSDIVALSKCYFLNLSNLRYGVKAVNELFNL
ncbi:MAG: hypothetical protein ACE5QV_01445 [Fidelibacterota bacterium]